MKLLWYEKPKALSELNVGRHGVIEASAGTGKTYTIEHLIVDLLSRDDLEAGALRIEELLVVTYTNAATADLKKKIRQTLKGLVDAWKVAEHDPGEHFVWDGTGVQIVDKAPGHGSGARGSAGSWVALDEDAVARLRRGLRNFDQAAIYTIHGFCQRVLTEHAFATGRLFDQEHRTDEEVLEEATGHFLREEVGQDPVLREWMELYLGSGKKISDLRKLLDIFGSGNLDVRPTFDADEIRKNMERLVTLGRNPAAVAQWERLLKKNGIGTRSINAAVHNHFASIIDKLAAVVDRPGEVSTPRLLQAAANSSSEKTYFSGKGNGPKIMALPNEVSDLLEEFFRVGTSFEAAIGSIFGERIRERVISLKEKEGYFTYQDMLELVAETLRKDEGSVLSSLRERFRYGIIDEFQDTDERQWEIFRRIFVESPKKDRHFLTVVGDPKQSIYGFRGGDVFTYIDAREVLIGDKKPVFLKQNYRSTADVIDAYNAIFDRNAPGAIELGEKISYEHPVGCGMENFQCRIGGKDGEPVAPLTVFEVTTSEGEDINGARDALARNYAEMIRDILDHDEGYMTCVNPENGEWERLEEKDIYILCRKVRDCRRVADALRKVGVSYAFLKMDGLFQTREAEEIYDLLLALAAPGERSRRARAWMTAFFDLSLTHLENIDEIGEETAIYKRLLGWSALAKRRRYRELFSQLIEESGLIRRQLLLSDSERELTNYLHILEVLAEEANAQQVEVGELAALLKAYIDERDKPEGDAGNQQRLEVEERAVNILTAHSSKGLQRGIIFYLPGMSAIRDSGELRVILKENGERKKFTWMAGLSAMPQEMEEAYLEQTRAEEHRLNYVAMTRPEVMFVIPYLGPDHPNYKEDSLEPSKRPPYFDICDRLTDLKGELRFQKLVDWKVVDADKDFSHKISRAQVREHLQSWKIPEGALPDFEDPQWQQEQREQEKKRKQLLSRRWEITSYSKLKGTAGGEIEDSREADRAGYDDPYFAEDGVRIDELPGGMNTGNFLHNVLEEVDFGAVKRLGTLEKWQQDEELRALFDRIRRRYGIDEEYLDVSMEIVFNALQASAPLPDSPLMVIDGLHTLTQKIMEMEFLFPVPEKMKKGGIQRQFEGLHEVRSGFVRGFVDMVFAYEGKVFFADWKSDICRSYQLGALKDKVEDRYANQANLYTLAMCRVLGIETQKAYQERFGGLYYFFLRGMRPGRADGVYYERLRWEDLLKYESQLEGAVEAIKQEVDGGI